MSRQRKSTCEGTGVKGMVRRECVEEDCLEEPRLERSRAGPKGLRCQAQGWPFCCGHVCEGESCVWRFSVFTLRAPPARALTARWALRSPLPTLSLAARPPALLLLRLMTAHRSSASLGSSGASSHPPNAVDSAIFDLHVPELYRQSSAYHQIN